LREKCFYGAVNTGAMAAADRDGHGRRTQQRARAWLATDGLSVDIDGDYTKHWPASKLTQTASACSDCRFTKTT
jgi:hypothetical protein